MSDEKREVYRVSRREFLAAASVLATSFVVSGCASGVPIVPSMEEVLDPTSERLPGELSEYQGAELDYLSEVRENSIEGPQFLDLITFRLKVFGLVETPLLLKYDEVIDRHSVKRVITLNCIEGWSVDMLWNGVFITDLLEQAGYDTNAAIVIFRCADGYSTSLPLDFIRENELLMAYEINGIQLPPERGKPLHVVAEGKYGYKWAKWVTSIEVSNDAEFEGYWEEQGYSNEADVG